MTVACSRSDNALRLRDPAFVMTPHRLSAQKQMRLSFIRLLMRRAILEQWRIDQRSALVDAEGRGMAIYGLEARGYDMHAIVFSDKLGADKTDRAIATRWDLTMCLVEGELDDALVSRVQRARPRDGGAGSDPRLGRVDSRALLWLCGNRSSRIFDHVVDSLTAGLQPDMQDIAAVGYLMRGINHVANGMMNTRMFAYLPDDHPLRGPYFAQMLGCYLIREISCDLVELIARARSDRAVRLDERIRRYLGVGDSTGIGLGLMINRHPILMDRWISLRETALASAKDMSDLSCRSDARRLLDLIARCIRYHEEDRTDQGFYTPSATIARELQEIHQLVTEFAAAGTLNGSSVDRPWAHLADVSLSTADAESQETFNAILVELYPTTTDALAPEMIVNETFDVVPEMTVADLRDILVSEYNWALDWDLSAMDARYWLWYRTAVGGEPRRSQARAEDADSDRNVALDLVGEVQGLQRSLENASARESIASFLIRNMAHRSIVERIQSVSGLNYHSPRMNMLEKSFIPIDLGRFVLFALKGMTKPSPQNNVWIRGVMAQGAPTMAEIRNGAEDEWIFPAMPEVER